MAFVEFVFQVATALICVAGVVVIWAGLYLLRPRSLGMAVYTGETTDEEDRILRLGP